MDLSWWQIKSKTSNKEKSKIISEWRRGIKDRYNKIDKEIQSIHKPN